MSEPKKVTALAQNKWKSILTELGVPEKILDGRHHPCPRSGEGEDRFRFSNKGGKGNFFCACNDGRSDGFKLLECMFGTDFKDAADKVKEIVGAATEDADDGINKEHAHRDLRKIQSSLLRVKSHEKTKAYLRGRGINVDEVFHPGPVRDGFTGYGLRAIEMFGQFHAMVAKVIAPDGRPCTYHITYLDGDKKAAHKRSRIIATPIESMAGGAVRLAPWTSGPLGIAEGIETAYSASELFKMPVWAALNAAQMQKFEPPNGCNEVVIFADNDDNYTGQAAAFALAKRLKLQLGKEMVKVRIPPEVGTDFNDVLQGVRDGKS